MEHSFNITMHAPLGKRFGNLSFSDEGGKICGTLSILCAKSAIEGTLSEKGVLEFTGKITSLMHTFTYKAKGTLSDSFIKLKVEGGRYSFFITGEEITKQEEN